ncbi:MAG: apolipoprotein N-acyltransferase [Bacteroidetes bacterium]|nr:apolipoprotein N-acyltransferase [Bacteroidota bacterium]
MNIRDTPAQKTVLAFATAILFWLAWPSKGFAPMLFIALIPLLLLENTVYQEKIKKLKSNLFPYTYLAFFLFNILNTWWIWYASPFGMFGAVTANALLMTIAFHFFHWTRLKFGNGVGYTSLPIYWVAFEYFHLDWDLSWTWLNFGNGLAAWADLVQWYEYTGVLGGTFWIILINIFAYHVLQAGYKSKPKIGIALTALILLPIGVSYLIRIQFKEKQNLIEVVIVQPNIDPYNEKFSGNSDEQLSKILKLADTQISNKTSLLILPETALPDGIWNEDLEIHPQIERLKEYVKNYPNLKILTGLSYYRYYHPGEKISATARKFRDGPGYYDAFNAAVQISNSRSMPLHMKSKLVPGVEKMPFPAIFGYLDDFAIDLGGTTGSLGSQESPTVFSSGKIIAAPVICYESVYGDYVGEYIRKGANVICIMTNDGWWDDTPGYRQHCQYGRLRAIEHRRSITRSANTGISCFINQLGDITQPTEWWEPACIKQNINLNNELTFYSKHGDIIGRSSFIGAAFFLAITILGMLFKRKK